MTMPIRDLQQRHAEHGRIRIGRKVATSNGKSRPDKLDRFRFTSGDRGHIEALAAKYGGTPAEWKNGTKTEWEVITDARAIPVIAYRNSVSQWMETWSGGGCTHRCDGYHNVLTDSPCDPSDRAHQDAKPTTRLSVMLRDLDSLGTWRLETHGWNAAAELPAMAELAAFVGDYIPARLVLQQRTSIRDGKTSQFVVPVLDLAITKQRLNDVLAGAPNARSLEASGSALQIEAGAPDIDDLIDAIADATSKDELNRIWRQAGETGRLTEDVRARIIAAGAEIDADTPPTSPAQTPPTATAPTDDPWMACVMFAGEQGWSTDQLVQLFEETYAIPVGDGEDIQFRDFLGQLRSGAVKAA